MIFAQTCGRQGTNDFLSRYTEIGLSSAIHATAEVSARLVQGLQANIEPKSIVILPGAVVDYCNQNQVLAKTGIHLANYKIFIMWGNMMVSIL